MCGVMLVNCWCFCSSYLSTLTVPTQVTVLHLHICNSIPSNVQKKTNSSYKLWQLSQSVSMLAYSRVMSVPLNLTVMGNADTQHPSLTLPTPLLKGSDMLADVVLLLVHRSNLAGCPSCHHHWLILLPAGVELGFAGCKSVTEPWLLLELLIYKCLTINQATATFAEI